MTNFFLIVLLAFPIASSNVVKLSEITCKDRDTGKILRHTMAIYTSSEPAEKCGTPVQIGLTKPQIQEVLEAHNEVRSAVGKNLPPLEWDETLASVAQRWANQCPKSPNAHDRCRDIVQGQRVGQNFVGGDQQVVNVKNIVKTWSVQKAYVTDDVLKSWRETRPSSIHYTQMVWRETTKIGCGFLKTQPGNRIYFVCNYNPGGNIEGQPVH